MKHPVMLKLRLYVAGDALNSVQAIANITAICEAHAPHRHAIEIVDVYREPRRAMADGILMTPTLVKVSPSPARRIVGTLSRTHAVLEALGLETVIA